MTARAVGLGIVAAPFVSAFLLGLGRAGRALANLTYRKDR